MLGQTNNQGYQVMPVDRDPYSPLRDSWVRINTNNRNEFGKLVGLATNKLIVLQPYLCLEILPSDTDKSRSPKYVIVDKPALISDAQDVNILPLRKEFIEELTGVKLEDKV